LQQNWKVKRQRGAASAPGSEGFTIDLFDNSLYDPAAVFRPSSLSTVRVDHDSAGMLSINLPPNSCRSLQFCFLGRHSDDTLREPYKTKTHPSTDHHSRESEKESLSDDEYVKETHSLVREVHRAIFDEQVFSFPIHILFCISLIFLLLLLTPWFLWSRCLIWSIVKHLTHL
jgi:mediator of RNA polymerase II transcription subunit 17